MWTVNVKRDRQPKVFNSPEDLFLILSILRGYLAAGRTAEQTSYLFVRHWKANSSVQCTPVWCAVGLRLGAGFRTGQDGQLTRGLHNQGSSTYVLSTLIFWYSRVGWASTAPLLKATQGSPQPGVLHICLVTFNILLF